METIEGEGKRHGSSVTVHFSFTCSSSFFVFRSLLPVPLSWWGRVNGKKTGKRKGCFG
jgi:hypothetical protein